MALGQYPALLSGLHPQLQNPWLQAATIIAASVLLALLVIFIIDRVIIRLTKKTSTDIDDILIAKSRRPLFFIILFLGIKAALVPLQLNGLLDRLVSSASALLFVYLLGSVLSIRIEAWGKHLAKRTRTHLDETLLPLLHKSSGVLFFIIALLWVFRIWNVDITPYLAGLGLGGLVLGLALQDTLKNIFGGIALILDRNFNIGDRIKLESGEMGEILDIGLRSTKLLTFDNEVIFVPNGQLANMRIQNYVRPEPRLRVVVKFSVAYGSDIAKVKETVVLALRAVEGASDKPYMDASIVEMSDFALHGEARFFIESYRDAYAKKAEAVQKIYDALNKAGIAIPFPTRTVYMKKEK